MNSREKFIESFKQVVSILGIDPKKLSRDQYRDTCYDNGIKYVDAYPLGGYGKLKDEIVSSGFEQPEESEENCDVREAMRHYLHEYIINKKYIPTAREYKSVYGYQVSKYYDTMEDFVEDTINNYSDLKGFTFNELDFGTQEYRNNVIKTVKNSKKFIITAAVCGKDVEPNFYNSLKTYAKKNKATVLVLPIQDSNSRSLYHWNLDRRLNDFTVVVEDEIKLNNNLAIWDVLATPRQIKSLTGLDRVTASLDSSIIVASTKQSLKYIPTSKSKTPHMLASTGCCTVNDYTKVGLMPNRASKIAEVMHTLGAIVIEVENQNIFHSRNIEAGPDGEIIDLGKKYSADGKVTVVKDNVLVVGDLHVPKHNTPLINKQLELINKLNVGTVVLHDTINMGCISHHNVGKRCLKALQALRDENTIENEAKELKTILEKFCKACYDVIIPFSNHPEHLNKYLEEARFVDDSVNFYISLELAKAYMDGKNVLQYLMEKKIGLKANNISWLNEDDDYSKYKVQLGYHGSERCNGGKASPTTFAKGLGKIVLAHKHSPSIEENAFVVGTACLKDQGYNKGMSSWMNTSALVYPNGTVQLINFLEVDGKYKCGM